MSQLIKLVQNELEKLKETVKDEKRAAWQKKERIAKEIRNRELVEFLKSESEEWIDFPDEDTSKNVKFKKVIDGARAKQKAPIKYFEPANPIPPMLGWTSIPRSVMASDSKVLNHIPYVSDETCSGLVEELIEQYDGMHLKDQSSERELIDDELFLRLANALTSKVAQLKRIRNLRDTKEGNEKLKSDENLKKQVQEIQSTWTTTENFPDSIVFQAISTIYPTKVSAKDLVSKFLELSGHPATPKKTIPNIDSPNAEALPREKALSTFKTLFCRRCFIYDCQLHLSPNVPKEASKPRPLRIKSDKPCGPHCYMLLGENKTDEPTYDANNNALDDGDGLNVKTDNVWTGADVTTFNMYHEIFPGNYCEIAKVLIFKTCQEVHSYARKHAPVSTLKTVVPKTQSSKKIDGKRRSALMLKSDNLQVNAHYRACQHEGPCSKSNDCDCLKNGTFCQKFCCCDDKFCRNLFTGCHCRGNCQNKVCPCSLAMRECDPELCRNCRINGNDSVVATCKNAGIQQGKHKHILLAPSEVSGWGVFAKDEIEKNDFIYEYVGEMISQEEADRRGKIYDKKQCSYQFELNSEFVVDATRLGNKIRFANHSDNPNCYAKVMMVNGDHRIGVYAAREIQAGEELFFDYSKYFTIDFNV